jgi:hypothetical protein
MYKQSCGFGSRRWRVLQALWVAGRGMPRYASCVQTMLENVRPTELRLFTIAGIFALSAKEACFPNLW